jgi:hypothetical protein
LGITATELVFDDAERGPDDELRVQFEAIGRSFSPDEKSLGNRALPGVHEFPQRKSSSVALFSDSILCV